MDNHRLRGRRVSYYETSTGYSSNDSVFYQEERHHVKKGREISPNTPDFFGMPVQPALKLRNGQPSRDVRRPVSPFAEVPQLGRAPVLDAMPEHLLRRGLGLDRWSQLEQQLKNGPGKRPDKSLVRAQRYSHAAPGEGRERGHLSLEPYASSAIQNSATECPEPSGYPFHRGRQRNSSPRPRALQDGGPQRLKIRKLPFDILAEADPEDSGVALGDHVPARQVGLSQDLSKGNSKDMSVRLALDVEEDWDADLEDFCRLRRLGRFKEVRGHFRETLEHLSDVPYIWVQHAEMLLAAGDYRALQNLTVHPQLAPGAAEEETPEDRNRGKLAANFAPMDLLSQRHIPDYVSVAWRIVRTTMAALATEREFGSTEAQLLALCLRVLRCLETYTNEDLVGPAKVYTKHVFNWALLYHNLVGEARVWDFRDVFVNAVSVFGRQGALMLFFGTNDLTKALDLISRDWSAPLFDEGLAMGLLDLFTSLILLDPGEGAKTQNSTILQQAETLARLAEHNDPELMRSRPFVQFLLAKAVFEMAPTTESSDGVRLQGFNNGLNVDRGLGVHLPVYVPSGRGRKPGWDMFSFRSDPSREPVIEVALRAADEMGDYGLQADAMKILALQSQEPKEWMDALARWQLSTQGDKHGYLETCLARYLVIDSQEEEAALLEALEKPRGPGNAPYIEQCEDATLKWACEVMQIVLGSVHEGNGARPPAEIGFRPLSSRGLSLEGSTLPWYIADFTRHTLGISLPLPMGTLPLSSLVAPEGDAEDGDLHAALLDRFDRSAGETSRPRQGFEGRYPAAFGTMAGMHHSPSAPPDFDPMARAPPPPPRPSDYMQHPDPLAAGMAPSIHVAGWPDTWYDDAKRAINAQRVEHGPQGAAHGRADGQDQQGQTRTPRGGQRGNNKHESQDVSQEEDIDLAEGGKRKAYRNVGEASTAEQTPGSHKPEENQSSRYHKKRWGILKELASNDASWVSHEGAEEGEVKGRAADIRPNVCIEDGTTKLTFPGDVLKSSGMTVLLEDKKDPQKLKAYIVGEGGVFETVASRPIRHRGDAPLADTEKSNYKVRTSSVAFDVVSSSSESMPQRRAAGMGRRKGRASRAARPHDGGGGSEETGTHKQGDAGQQEQGNRANQPPSGRGVVKEDVPTGGPQSGRPDGVSLGDGETLAENDLEGESASPSPPLGREKLEQQEQQSQQRQQRQQPHQRRTPYQQPVEAASGASGGGGAEEATETAGDRQKNRAKAGADCGGPGDGEVDGASKGPGADGDGGQPPPYAPELSADEGVPPEAASAEAAFQEEMKRAPGLVLQGLL